MSGFADWLFAKGVPTRIKGALKSGGAILRK
jgi:hypothetical protein